eukprot:COSAG06_NODE_66520_length_254_cov_0.664516_1_plen_34_part_01
MLGEDAAAIVNPATILNFTGPSDDSFLFDDSWPT